MSENVWKEQKELLFQSS